MALKAMLDKLDGVPEAQRSLYVERDGKYVLDVDGESAEEAFAAGLKRNRDEMRRELDQARKRLKDYDGVDPEEHRRLKQAADEAERKKAAAEGDFKAIEQQLKSRHAEEIGAVTKRLEKYQKAIDEIAVGQLAAALTKADARPEFAGLLLREGREYVRTRETDGGFETVVTDLQGNPMVANGQGDRMTPEQFVEQKLKTQYPDAFKGSGSSGGGASRSAGGAGGTTVIPAGDPKAFLANLEKIAKGETRVVSP